MRAGEQEILEALASLAQSMSEHAGVQHYLAEESKFEPWVQVELVRLLKSKVTDLHVEARTSLKGYVDITCIDSDGRPFAIELKVEYRMPDKYKPHMTGLEHANGTLWLVVLVEKPRSAQHREAQGFELAAEGSGFHFLIRRVR